MRLPNGTGADSAWRVVTLRLRDDTDGDIVHITTLRPPQWLAEHGIDGPGRQLRMSFPELGTAGWATTESIAPVPLLDSGPGRVVLATLRHYNDDVHALRFEQVDDVLEVTGRHPFWSVDRRDWVRVESLYIGERLESRDGVVTVAEIGPVPGRHEVFNLTVEGDHEYLVGPAGVRTHNSGRKNCGAASGRTLNDPLPAHPKKPTQANPHAPDPDAQGPHTVVGTRTDPKRSPEPYRQGITYDARGNPVGRTDATTHGRGDHTNPHWHQYDPTIQNRFDPDNPGNFGPAQPMP